MSRISGENLTSLISCWCPVKDHIRIKTSSNYHYTQVHILNKRAADEYTRISHNFMDAWELAVQVDTRNKCYLIFFYQINYRDDSANGTLA